MPPKFARATDGGYKDVERQALLDADSEEDDFFLNGPRVNTQRIADPKMSRNTISWEIYVRKRTITRLRGQVDEVVDVMKANVSRVVERGDRLEDLQDKSDSLAGNSDLFRNRAKALHKTMWWKNCRMRLIIALVIIVILAVIIIPIIVTQTNKDNN